MPKTVTPQLATLTAAAPEGEAWLHEVKFDGYRELCFKNGDHVRLITRNQNDWSARFPQIVAACRKLAVERAVMDGEAVIIGPDGRADFQALQNHMQGEAAGQLTYYVFDLLYADGYSLTAAPLVERKNLLEQIVAASRGLDGVIQFSDHLVGHGPIMLEQARRAGLEGIMSKRVDSPYRGGRTSDWLKIKCHQRQEFVIGGYTPPSGSRKGFGALLLGFYEPGTGLVYCGRVGTGFSVQSLREIAKQLKSRAAEKSPFDVAPARAEARGAKWVRPELVAEVEFGNWTSDDRLRHPSFQGSARGQGSHDNHARAPATGFSRRRQTAAETQVRPTRQTSFGGFLVGSQRRSDARGWRAHQ